MSSIDEAPALGEPPALDEAPKPDIFRGHAFIVGAMKCGTSTLHHLLAQHPQLAKGRKKEINYFTRFDAPTAEAYEQVAFPELDRTAHIYTLDSSPNYAKVNIFPDAPKRLAAMPGDKRLIYLMRDPVDRIESHFTHNAARGRPIDDKAIEVAVQTSHYAWYLDLFKSLGMPDPLLLDFDELVADPIAMANRAFAFLEIEPVPLEFDRPRNVRRIEARFTTPEDEARYAALVRDDVQQLLDRHHFEPARKWGIA